MLEHAAEGAFADRTLILEENRYLFQSNMAKEARQSRGMALLGTARVMTYEDLARARTANEVKKVRKSRRVRKPIPRVSDTRVQDEQMGVAEESHSVEDISSDSRPWIKYQGVIDFAA
jgi:hypothetical protein